MDFAIKPLKAIWLCLCLIFVGLTIKAIYNCTEGKTGTSQTLGHNFQTFPSLYVCPIHKHRLELSKNYSLNEIENLPSVTDYIELTKCLGLKCKPLSKDQLQDFFWISSYDEVVSRCLFVNSEKMRPMDVSRLKTFY